MKWAAAITACALAGVALEPVSWSTRLLAQLAAFVVVVVAWEGIVDEVRLRRLERLKRENPGVLVERAVWRDAGVHGEYVLIHAEGSPPDIPKEFYELPSELADRVREHVADASIPEAVDVLCARDELAQLPERNEP